MASPIRDLSRPRALTLAVVLWLFGLATTVLLIGVWGRAVTVDEATLDESARAVLAAGFVHQRVTDWVDDGAGGMAAAGPKGEVVEAALGDPDVRVALDGVVADIVAAALAPPGAGPSLDLAASLGGVATPLASALADRGVEVDRDALGALLTDTSLLLVDDTDAIVGGAAGRAHAFLTTVVVVAGGALVVTGAVSVALSPDRLASARGLLVRLAVSAGTFAVVLRVGAWAVDPRGGRSPLGSGGSIILASNGGVVVGVGVLALLAAALASLALARRSTRRARFAEVTGEVPVAVLG